MDLVKHQNLPLIIRSAHPHPSPPTRPEKQACNCVRFSHEVSEYEHHERTGSVRGAPSDLLRPSQREKVVGSTEEQLEPQNIKNPMRSNAFSAETLNEF